MTIGYVTAAKVDYPKKKVLNNVTNRMNTVDDYAAFAKNLGKTGDVCESGHLYGHDSDGNVFTNSEETYRGVEGSRFISHGEWSDPEIWYNGKSANANDVEDMMWEYYKEECEERGVVPSDEEFDNLPAEWFKEHLDEYFSEM